MDGLVSFHFSETSGHKVCLLRLKEEIIEKWSPFCPHPNADYLLKNTTTKQINYVVNKEFKHLDDVSFSECL